MVAPAPTSSLRTRRSRRRICARGEGNANMSTLKVAAAQLGPASPDKADTISRIVALIDEAVGTGVQFIVFPELAMSPYFATTVHGDAASFAEASFPSAETAPIIEAIRRNNITTFFFNDTATT